MIRVVTAIPNPVMDKLLCDQIDHVPDFLLVGRASDPDELSDLPRQAHPDVVISSWNEPDRLPEVFHQMFARFPHVVIVNILSDDETVVLYRQEIVRHTLPSVEVVSFLPQIRESCEETTCVRTWPRSEDNSQFDVSKPFLLGLN